MNYSSYFSMIDYYKKVVVPVNKLRYWVKSDKMMVCPLHDDINPSMGIITDKDGNELFHCFGCNRWGNIVKLHKEVSKRLFKRYLSEEESLKDLCRIFNISYNDVFTETIEVVDDGIRSELALRDALDKFDISDYRIMFIKGKVQKKSVAYFNTLTMMMINELNS